jgi:F-type H+-transporting ATPase subunit epsilon
MSDQLFIKIITPEGILYESSCSSISVETSEGEITILANHIPLISPVKHGEVRIIKDGETLPFAISGGVVEVEAENKILLLVESGEDAAALDETSLSEAIERAQKAMADKDNTMDLDFVRFSAQLDRDLNKLRVAKKWRK